RSIPGGGTMNTPTNITRGYLRKYEAADYLGISRRTLGNLMRAGKIPYSRLTGRLVLFRASALDAALEKFQVGGKEVSHV
ncbi:MAG: helix-turn-helix domain-containing protein, partial [Kiritimatiellota bacterium]|nr:helix-turn-helix domain-containing protein [Kiritimatiellota bacterium]